MGAKPAVPTIEAPLAEPPTVSPPSTVTLTQPAPSARPSVRTTTPRYQYVPAEIRKIAIITAVILAILITLAFVL